MPPVNRNVVFTLIIGLVVLGVAAWWPVSYNEPLTRGIDAYQYHGPLFAQHTQSQDIVIKEPLELLGALIVPLRPSHPTPDILVTFTDPATDTVLQSHTIGGSTLTDDAFTSVHLDPPLNHPERIRVTFSAPTATIDSAVGIRFHPDNVYPAGQRLFDERVVEGDLALSLQRRLPLWRVVLKNAALHSQKTTILLEALALSLVAAAVASQIGWSRLTLPRQRILELSLLGVVALAALVGRLPTIPQLGGVSGGDPYNYLFITDRVSNGENPLADKRLPGYPLLLLPAYVTDLDDIVWMRFLGSVSAGGIVFLVGLLARRIGLPWSVQFLAAFLLAFQKDFYWVSLRPEAYTVYALLMLAALVLFFSLTTWRRHVLFGLVLGYAAMTRQEGFVLAAVLGMVAVVHITALTLVVRFLTRSAPHPNPLSTWGEGMKKYGISFLPALLLVLPFFINNAIAYGNPLYTPYFAGERLEIVDSWGAFQDALGATWGVLGSMWKPSWDQLERLSTDSPLFVGSIGVCFLWWIYHRYRAARSTVYESVLMILVSLGLLTLASLTYANGTNAFVQSFVVFGAAALVVSPIFTITTARWPGVVLVLVTVSQLLIATWFHPFPKHYQQDFPLLVIGVAITLIASVPLSAGYIRRIAAGTTFLVIVFSFALTTLPLYQPGRFTTNIDKYNQNIALDSVTYRAIQVARQLPAPYGFDQTYLPAQLYMGQRMVSYNRPTGSSPAEESAWLTDHNIQTLVTTNLDPVFMDLPASWQLVAHFKAEGKDEQLLESFVYKKIP